MRRLPALVIALLGFWPAAPATARGARPASGPCLVGSPVRCQFWYGRLKSVGDGDTIDVRIRGVGVRRIRFTGINAMELTRYSHTPSKRRGACHAKAAAARLD